MKNLKSKFLFVYIQCIRVIDHTWRQVNGLPLARYSVVTPHLMVGGQYSPKIIATLNKLGVTGIVNMRETPVSGAVKIQFKTLHIPTINYHAPTLDQLKSGTDFIKQQIDAGGKLYIHCQLGEGRGPTMAIAYLLTQGLTYEDALRTVSKVRPFIHLSAEQTKRLKQYETTLT